MAPKPKCGSPFGDRPVMRNRSCLLSGIVALSCLLTGVTPATAQEATPPAAQAPRITVQLNGAFQAAPSAFGARSTEQAYGEEATFETLHSLDGGPTADASLMLHLDDRFGLGAAVSWMRVADTATFAGAVPHPLEAERPRMPPPQEFAFEREELAVHLFAAWRIPLSERMELTLSGGPTAVNVTQDTVVGLLFREGAPPDFEQIGLEAETGEQRRNAIGGHVGIDLVFMATRHLGFGYFVRFARATVELPGRGEATITANAGNVQTGAGFRFRF